MTLSSEKDARYNAIAAHVTLDGIPAKVSGLKSDFATISALPDGPSFQFSWPATHRIIKENSGQFRT